MWVLPKIGGPLLYPKIPLRDPKKGTPMCYMLQGPRVYATQDMGPQGLGLVHAKPFLFRVPT